LLIYWKRTKGRNEGARAAQLTGHGITGGGAEKSQPHHRYFLQHRKFIPKRSPVWKWNQLVTCPGRHL